MVHTVRTEEATKEATDVALLQGFAIVLSFFSLLRHTV